VGRLGDWLDSGGLTAALRAAGIAATATRAGPVAAFAPDGAPLPPAAAPAPAPAGVSLEYAGLAAGGGGVVLAMAGWALVQRRRRRRRRAAAAAGAVQRVYRGHVGRIKAKLAAKQWSDGLRAPLSFVRAMRIAAQQCAQQCVGSVRISKQRCVWAMCSSA
jgi:hypothetical protein